MARQSDTQRGWIGRWREHRRAKGQARLERRHHHHERARATGIASPEEDFTMAKAYGKAYPIDSAGPWGGMVHDVTKHDRGDSGTS